MPFLGPLSLSLSPETAGCSWSPTHSLPQARSAARTMTPNMLLVGLAEERVAVEAGGGRTYRQVWGWAHLLKAEPPLGKKPVPTRPFP